MQARVKVITVASLLFVVITFWIGIASKLRSLSLEVAPTPRPLKNLGELSRLSGVDFPATSQVTASEMLDGYQKYAYVIIRLPRKDAIDFIHRSDFKGLVSGSKSDIIGFDLLNPWLTKLKDENIPKSLNNIHNFRGIDILSHSKKVSLLFDFDRSQTAVLYIYYVLI